MRIWESTTQYDRCSLFVFSQNSTSCLALSQVWCDVFFSVSHKQGILHCVPLCLMKRGRVGRSHRIKVSWYQNPHLVLPFVTSTPRPPLTWEKNSKPSQDSLWWEGLQLHLWHAYGLSYVCGFLGRDQPAPCAFTSCYLQLQGNSCAGSTALILPVRFWPGLVNRLIAVSWPALGLTATPQWIITGGFAIHADADIRTDMGQHCY